MKKDTKYHFRLNGDFIECWDGNNSYTRIATVIVRRPVLHLVRRVQLAEDIEELMDSFIADTCGSGPAILKE